MYLKSHCLQLLNVKSVSEQKFFFIKRLSSASSINPSGVNYLAYSYSDFITIVTTFIFIFDFNIVSIYKVTLINK